eukprot:537759_1
MQTSNLNSEWTVCVLLIHCEVRSKFHDGSSVERKQLRDRLIDLDERNVPNKNKKRKASDTFDFLHTNNNRLTKDNKQRILDLLAGAYQQRNHAETEEILLSISADNDKIIRRVFVFEYSANHCNKETYRLITIRVYTSHPVS